MTLGVANLPLNLNAAVAALAERHAAARRDAGHERRIAAGPRQARAALRPRHRGARGAEPAFIKTGPGRQVLDRRGLH